MSILAARIERFREAAGLSQGALSRKAGLAPSAVNDIVQNADRSPRLMTVEALASALGVGLGALLGIEEDAERDAGDGQPRAFLREVSPSERTNLLHGIDIREIAAGADPADLAFFRVIHAAARPFGHAPGDVLVVRRCKSRPPSGRKVVAQIRGERGAEPVVAYFAEPYLFRFAEDGRPTHDYADGERGRIVGIVAAAIRIEVSPIAPEP